MKVIRVSKVLILTQKSQISTLVPLPSHKAMLQEADARLSSNKEGVQASESTSFNVQLVVDRTMKALKVISKVASSRLKLVEAARRH